MAVPSTIKAAALDCRLVSYSWHELNLVQTHLPAESPVRKAFEDRFYNVKIKAKSLANRRKLDVGDKKLDDLMRALAPRHKSPPPPEIGPAEACRRLRRAGAKSQRWRNWSQAHQDLAKELIAYNRGDCTAVWCLVNRVSANYRIKELS